MGRDLLRALPRRVAPAFAMLLAATLASACAAQAAFASTAAAASPSGGAGAIGKLVVVGDSYSRANAKGIVAWPHLAAEQLGLERGQYTLVRHGGYSFAKPGHRFISLIRKQRRDESVTHVLIMGGVGNDYVSTRSQSLRCYAKTVRLLKAKYPNASIAHAVTSWRLENKAYQKAIVKRIPAFRAKAKALGVTYLKGGENIMRKHPKRFLPDKIHPNQAGHDAIARFVVKKLRTYGAADSQGRETP